MYAGQANAFVRRSRWLRDNEATGDVGLEEEELAAITKRVRNEFLNGKEGPLNLLERSGQE